MSAFAPGPGTRVMRQVEGFRPVVYANIVLGLPAYFVSFLLAYGFRDDVGPAEHLRFLVLIATFASVSGLVSLAGHPVPGHRWPDAPPSAYCCLSP